MPCCLFYFHIASQLDPKPFKRVIDFWFSSTCVEVSHFFFCSRRIQLYPSHLFWTN